MQIINMDKFQQFLASFDGKCMDGIACKNENSGIIPVIQRDSETGDERPAGVCFACLNERDKIAESKKKEETENLQLAKRAMEDPELKSYLKQLVDKNKV